MIQEKLPHEIYLNIPEFFIKGKYAKFRFKNRESTCFYLISRGQKINHIIKVNKQKRPFFVYILGFTNNDLQLTILLFLLLTSHDHSSQGTELNE